MKKALSICLAILACVLTGRAQTGTPTPTIALPPPEGEDSDPTRPVAWSLREEFYKIRGDDWVNAFIFRRDAAAFANRKRWWSGRRGIITRFDLPITVANHSGEMQWGLGDLYLQAIYVPYLTRKFAFAGGTGISLPTATDSFLGTGKVTLAPIIAPVWFIPKRGIFLVKFQDYISVGGDGTRPDLHYFSITPLLVWRLKGKWWTQLDGETKTNFENDGSSGYKAGVLLGRMLKNRVGVWVKVELPFGSYRDGDFTIKTSIFRIK